MWDVHKDCRRVLVIAATVLVAGVVLAPAAQAGALPQVTTVSVSAPSTAKASACITLDGTARNALTYGSNPTRYKYSGSPYLGLRYSSCAGTIRVYFGGFNGVTHYNIKPVYPNTTQFEVLGGVRRSITRNETDWGLRGFTVQGCSRGGLFSSSTCTRWSPTVTILIPKEAAAQ